MLATNFHFLVGLDVVSITSSEYAAANFPGGGLANHVVQDEFGRQFFFFCDLGGPLDKPPDRSRTPTPRLTVCSTMRMPKPSPQPISITLSLTGKHFRDELVSARA